MEQLPILQVIIPLLAAPIAILCRNSYISWGITLLATWSAFAVAIIMVVYNWVGGGALVYALGDWPAPIGIEYRIDMLSSFILMMLTGFASIMMPYAWESINKEILPEKRSLFYGMFLLCLSGYIGMVTTNDVFNIYVFLEIASLATYTLIAMGKGREALTSAIRYLIVGTIGAIFFLLGIGLLYMMTGTLNLSDLAGRIGSVTTVQPLHAAFIFIAIGLAIKFALFPLHFWLPGAYTNSPSFVSAFLGAAATKISLYVLIRFSFSMFGSDFSFTQMNLSPLLIILGTLAILYGSGMAVLQKNVKYILAYSSVAQIGFITLGLGLVSKTGLTASIMHLLNHGFAVGALFLAVGCVFYRTSSAKISSFNGVGRIMPGTMTAFMIAGLSVIGIPGTAGFISKWYFLQALVEQKFWMLLVVLLLSSIMAAMYIWKVIEVAFFRSGKLRHAGEEAPRLMLISTWIMVALNIYFGFYTDISLGIAERIASILIKGWV